MNIPARTQRFRKIAIAVVMLSIAQLSYDGFVLCYGADGHVEIALPAAKDCCATNTPGAALSATAQFDTGHCIDIPLGGHERISAPGHFHHLRSCLIAVCVTPQPTDPAQRSCLRYVSPGLPPPHPLAASLKTVILLI